MANLARIYKYTIKPGDDLEIDGGTMRYSPILHVAEQQAGAVTFWMEYKNECAAEAQRRKFVILGTGFEVPEHHIHRGTVLMRDGLVWHLYEAIA